MMSRRLRTTLRNDAEGVTWTVYPEGAGHRIEILFDDDEKPLLRAIPRGERDALVAEQLASGFLLAPPWEPTPAWMRDASDEELAREVLDAWILRTELRWTRVQAAPLSVRAWLTLDALAAQCSRNGLAMHFTESDPELVGYTAEAARVVGLAELAMQFEGVAEGASRTGSRMKFGSRKTAKALEVYATMALPEVLSAWVRAHAEDFVLPHGTE